MQLHLNCSSKARGETIQSAAAPSCRTSRISRPPQQSPFALSSCSRRLEDTSTSYGFASSSAEDSAEPRRPCSRRRASSDEGAIPVGGPDQHGGGSGAALDPAERVDARWAGLPLDELRRPGEAAWDIDPDGPTGPERFDNVFRKRQKGLNATAIRVVGMGSWRLKSVVSPLLEAFVANIEGAWRHLIDDLGLHQLPPAYRYVDSLDPDGEYGSWSFQDLESPVRGGEGWPRLQIENRCYTSRAFRKLHLEVAHRQDGLEVLHCVMYPWVNYDLPILCMDLVAKDGVVSLGIIDPCPVSIDRALSPAYVQICTSLQQEFRVQTSRAMPDWGREIFSEQCIMIRPDSADELERFFKYAIALTRVHLRLARNAEPVQTNRASRTQLISAAQRRFSEQQLLNSKTRRVLESSFSKGFTDKYLSEVMFDTAPAAGEQAKAAEASPSGPILDGRSADPQASRASAGVR